MPYYDVILASPPIFDIAMEHYSAGDLVIRSADGMEMLIIGTADDQPVRPEAASFFCVWEQSHFLHEEVVAASELSIARRERRRIPRGGLLDFPTQILL